MKTAFLILAHSRPDAVLRLVERLANADSSFFLHVDALADVAPFHVLLGGRVHFIPDAERVPMYYTGFSMPRATLNLLADAVATSDAQRFVLLSGADYPIQPIQVILDEVALDCERVSIDRRCNPRGDSMFDRRAFRRYYGDSRFLNPRTGNPWLAKMVDRIARRLPRRQAPWPIYYGSAWWILTRTAATEILDLAARKPAAVDWFRHARSPSEMVIQTLLKRTTSATRNTDDATINPTIDPDRHVHAAVYVDFDGMTTGSPRTLELEDLDKLLASGALFARKCDPERSASLIDAIDRRVHRRLPSGPSQANARAMIDPLIRAAEIMRREARALSRSYTVLADGKTWADPDAKRNHDEMVALAAELRVRAAQPVEETV